MPRGRSVAVDDLRAAFERHDVDHSGSIDMQEFERLLRDNQFDIVGEEDEDEEKEKDKKETAS